MSTHTPGYEITFDGFGFNDAGDPYKRRLSTLPATWKDEGARQQFGHEVVRAVNTHAQLLEALKALTEHSAGTNHAFFVVGKPKALHAAMAGQKAVLEQARAAIAQAEKGY